MNLRQYLSCEQDINTPPFSTDDIQWISDILNLANGFDSHQLNVLQNLSFVDIEACPGSGKTTVLVAKLALLSRYWIPKDKGICVLSMTNAAREEIQQKLDHTFEGKALLQAPHFIGTIDSFAGKFLAKSWLNKHRMWIEKIDTDFCDAERLRVLQTPDYLALTDYLVEQQIQKKKNDLNSDSSTKKHKDAKEWLKLRETMTIEEKRLRIPVKNWVISDEKYNVVSSSWGTVKPLDLPAEMFDLVRKCVEEVANKGVFSYSDIFVFAKAQMKDCPHIFKVIRNRFPALFIDEAQDTSKSQAEFLYDLFINEEKYNANLIRQRYGDVNQTIYSFESPIPPEHIDYYPNKENKLSIPVSHRFDQSIANLVIPFEIVSPNTQTLGARVLVAKEPKEGRAHLVIFFSKDTRHRVIPSFLNYTEEQLLSDELVDANIHVCSHIHKVNKKEITEEIFARTISDYYPAYAGEVLTKDYQEHKYLIGYFNHALFLSSEKGYLKIGVEKISEGIIKSAFICKEISRNKIYDHSPYYKIRSADNKYREISKYLSTSNDVALTKFQALIRSYLIKKKSILNEAEWSRCLKDIRMIVSALLCDEELSMDDRFFEWNDSLQLTSNADINSKPTTLYEHEFLEITKQVKLGTIHSVKGQTHTATLLLESNYYKKSVIGKLKKIFLGESLASNLPESDLNKQNTREHINALYVGMTRPTHLLVIALPKNDWHKDEISVLKKQGWRIAELNQTGSLDYL